MRIDKYFQRKGYSNYRYRYVRRKVRKFFDNELRVEVTVASSFHRTGESVRLGHPLQVNSTFEDYN